MLIALILLLSTVWARGADLIMTVTPEQYGAVGDCVADDTAAFLAMRTNLRAFQDANINYTGGTIRQVMQLGGYGKCYAINDVRYIWGLKNLYIYGGGAQIMNYYPSYYFQMGSPPSGPYYTYDKDGNPLMYTYTGLTPAQAINPLGAEQFNRGGPAGWESCSTYTSGLCVSGFTGAKNPLLQTNTPGTNFVTTITPSDANPAIFTPGLQVVVGSYSKMMYNSYPPAYRFVDWAKVVSADPSTGIITLDRNVQYTHRANLPMEGSTGSTPGIGPARIHVASSSAIPMGDVLWIENVRINPNPHSGRSTYTGFTTQGNDYPQSYFSWYNGQYVLLTGYWDVYLVNSEFANITPSSLPHFHVLNSKVYGGGEMDKMISTVDVTNSSFGIGVGGCAGTDTVTFNYVSVSGPSYTGGATSCEGERYTMNGSAVFMSHAVSPYTGNFSLNQSFSTDSTVINNSTFVGSGMNTPFGTGPTGGSFTVETVVLDGTVYNTSGNNLINFTNLSTTVAVPGNVNGAGNIFMRCTYPGYSIDIVKGGVTYTGTVFSIVQGSGTVDPTLNVNLGAVLQLSAPVTAANGDSLVCHVHPPGSVKANNLSTRNFAGPVSLP
jgi:hypothetical protein